MNTRPTRSISRRPSNRDPETPPTLRWQRPLTRRAVRWAIAFAIPLAVMLAGGGVLLWTAYRDSRSTGITSLGATLFVFGFTAALVCFGAWVASSGHRGPGNGA
jgi:uncharacterized RDD family membrane protein YckC